MNALPPPDPEYAELRARAVAATRRDPDRVKTAAQRVLSRTQERPIVQPPEDPPLPKRCG